MSRLRKYLPLCGFYAFTFILFLLIEWPNAVMSYDDYIYSRVWTDNMPWWDFTGSKPMESWSEVIPSQALHYANQNGRFIVHALVQIYICFWGYKALAVTVALLSVCAVELLSRLSVRGAPTVADRLVTMVVFFLVMPFFAFCGVWFGDAAFSMNYVLPSTAMLLVLWLLRRRWPGAPCRWWAACLFALLGLVCGQLHEGFSVPLLGGWAVYTLLWHRRWDSRAWWLMAGVALGTLSVCLSPGIHRRATDASFQDESYIHNCLSDLYTVCEIFIPIIVVAAVVWALSRRKGLREKVSTALSDSRLAMAVGVVCLLTGTFLFRFKCGEPRCFCALGLMLTLLTARVLLAVRRPGRVASGVSVIFLTMVSGVLFAQGMHNYRLHQRYFNAYLSSPTGYVITEDTYPTVNPLNILPNGVTVPVPLNIYSREGFEIGAIRQRYAGERPPYVPVPNLEGLRPEDVAFDNGHIKIYTRPEVWWMVMEGSDRYDIEYYADGATPVRTLHALTERLTGNRYEPTKLNTDTVTWRGHRYKIIAKRSNLRLTRLIGLSPDGSPHYYPLKDN